MNYKKMLDVYAENSNKFCNMNVNLIKTLAKGIKYDCYCDGFDFSFPDGNEYYQRAFGNWEGNTYLNSILFCVNCPDNIHRVNIRVNFSPSGVRIYWYCRVKNDWDSSIMYVGTIDTSYSGFFRNSKIIPDMINLDVEEISTAPSEYMVRSYCEKMNKKDRWHDLIHDVEYY